MDTKQQHQDCKALFINISRAYSIMTTPVKRDSNERGGDHDHNNSSNGSGPQKPETASSSSSKRPKREEEHRWMTSRGRRQPRVGNEYQVASLPTPESSTAADITETIPDDEDTAPSSNSKADVMDKKDAIQQPKPE
jgi:DnaJ-class molecular chaperone